MVPKPIAAWIAGFALALSTSMLHAADLPKATQNILKKLKLTSEVMAGLDEELKVPQEWLDGANKEGVVRILGTWDPKQFVPLNTPFHERIGRGAWWARVCQYDENSVVAVSLKKKRIQNKKDKQYIN